MTYSVPFIILKSYDTEEFPLLFNIYNSYNIKKKREGLL